MAIQLFQPFYRTEECLEQIKECMEKGWTGLGYKTIEFEERWKEYTGFQNAHFLNSATAGLHLAVKILKEKYQWKDGDEVISTPLTFISTNHAITYEHLKVVFADVDEYLCLDPEDVERKITTKTKAIMFVGLGGNIGQYNGIVELCKKYNLALILDGAHMAGTRNHGNIPGKEADAVVYSFHAVKNLPTADSGMICFKENELDKICRKYTWLGINKDTYERRDESGSYKWKYDVEYLGYKYHGNSIMASIGLVQLKYLEEDNAYRRQLANCYEEGFKQCPDITSVPVVEECLPSRHLYIVELDHRDQMIQILNDHDIYPGVHYRDNTEYSMYSYGRGTCPKAHYYTNRILSLPLHLRMKKKDVFEIVKIMRMQGD